MPNAFSKGPTAPRTDQEQQLTELVRRRAQLLDLLVAQRQQMQRLTLTNSAVRLQNWSANCSSDRLKLNEANCVPKKGVKAMRTE